MGEGMACTLYSPQKRKKQNKTKKVKLDVYLDSLMCI